VSISNSSINFNELKTQSPEIGVLLRIEYYNKIG